MRNLSIIILSILARLLGVNTSPLTLSNRGGARFTDIQDDVQ